MAVQKLTLPGGRSLDYLISGSTADDAYPLVYHHGTPGAYPAMKSFASKCKEHNFKLITYSRAGYGDSTRNPGRKIVDVVGDIEALLAHLDIKRFVAAGWSGGGPHALACVARIKSCVGALCVAGVAPYDAEGLDYLAGQGEDNVQETLASLEGEDAVRKFVDAQRVGLLDADVAGIVKELSTILPEVDKKALLENGDIGQVVIDTFQEGLKHSSDGWVDDDLAFVAPWGFDLNEISKPVFLYQGSLDLMVPYGHGQWLAKHIPGHSLTTNLFNGEGHISIWPNYIESMLMELSTFRG